MPEAHPELVDFGGGVALRILPTHDGRWWISDGKRTGYEGGSIVEKQIVPSIDLQKRRFASRADAITAAIEWLTSQEW